MTTHNKQTTTFGLLELLSAANKRNLTYFYIQFFLGAWTAMTIRFWGNFQNKFTRKHTFLEKWIPSMLSEWSPLRRAAAPTRCCFACTPLPVQLRILWSRPEQPPAASTALQHYHYTAHSLGTQSVCTLQNMQAMFDNVLNGEYNTWRRRFLGMLAC